MASEQENNAKPALSNEALTEQIELQGKQLRELTQMVKDMGEAIDGVEKTVNGAFQEQGHILSANQEAIGVLKNNIGIIGRSLRTMRDEIMGFLQAFEAGSQERDAKTHKVLGGVRTDAHLGRLGGESNYSAIQDVRRELYQATQEIEARFKRIHSSIFALIDHEVALHPERRQALHKHIHDQLGPGYDQ